MRRVACYAAESAMVASEDANEVFPTLLSIIERWLRTKGGDVISTGSTAVTMADGRLGEITAQAYSTSTSEEWDISFGQGASSGRFLTRIVIGRIEQTIFLFVELRAGVDGYRLSPHEVDVRCPQVLRDLLGARTWTVGKTPVSLRPIAWKGADGGNRFIAVLEHKERNLPIVALSEFEGQILSPTLPDDLARDLCGLVIVAKLDDSASWTITRRRGKEWSCFDGAIRVYWPPFSSRLRASDNPLWTRQRLLGGASSEATAAEGIRTEIRQRLLELSTYAVDEPRPLGRIRESAAREKFEGLRTQAEESGTQGALAEEYFNQCVALTTTVADKEEEIRGLRAQVKNLNLAWSHVPGKGATSLSLEPEVPVANVLEAVTRAAKEFSDELFFGESANLGAKDLAPEAGPPEKIWEHLSALAELAQVRRTGSLGENLMTWLSKRGISASNESTFVENNKAERQKRTWDDGAGKRFYTCHTKPNDGTGPDKCVRIYFEYDEAMGKVIVGWVGRHP